MYRSTRQQHRISRRHQRLTVIVELEIYAPDEELAKIGATYCTLYRKLNLPFAPFVGLVLSLGESLLETDPRVPRYNELWDAVGVPNTLHEIKRVYWYPSHEEFHAICTNSEPTLHKFQSYIAFATEFCKFQRFGGFFNG